MFKIPMFRKRTAITASSQASPTPAAVRPSVELLSTIAGRVEFFSLALELSAVR